MVKKIIVLIFCMIGISSNINAATLKISLPGETEKSLLIDLKNGKKSVDISFYSGWSTCDFSAKDHLRKSKKIELAFLECNTKTMQQVLVHCQENGNVELCLGDTGSMNEGGGCITMQCTSK